MYLQNLSIDNLNKDELDVLSDIEKLKQIVLSAKYLIFIKKELISKSETKLVEFISDKLSDNSNYKNLYHIFMRLIDKNEDLEICLKDFIKKNLKFVNTYSYDSLNFETHVFEKSIIEKFNDIIQNTCCLLGMITKLNNNYYVFKQKLDQFIDSDKIVSILLDVQLNNLIYTYVQEINNTKNFQKFDKNINDTKELNKQLMAEISNLNAQLKESSLKYKYKDEMLSNLAEQMAIMQIEQSNDILEDEYENTKIMNDNLQIKIENLQKELNNKLEEIENNKYTILNNILEIDKFKYLFILMSFYSLTITLILIIYIRNNNRYKKCKLNKYHEIIKYK